MTRSSSSFVDPTTLSLPSAANSPESSTSSLPSTSASAKTRPPPSTSADGPPRKRSRTDMTPEERKEARAHRNRIAAQNSRDKRKAQFSHLEQRIAELESENRTLRASMGLTALRETEEQKAAEQAREQENRELRERIRTLESGWDAIIKALQTHGLPAGFPGLTPQAPTQTPTPRPEPRSPSSSHPTTFPVFIPPSPVFPLSPAPSQSSLSSSSPTGGLDATQLSSLDLSDVAMGLTTSPFGELCTASAPSDDIDEAAMEDLFREILAPSPTVSAAQVPVPAAAAAPPHSAAVSMSVSARETATDFGRDCEAEAEMQRLLDMLPTAGDGASMGLLTGLDISSGLDLDLGAWELGTGAPLGAQVF
ncbi:hypothetical protein EVG20_g5351 [Dentipellis fragilis]|uniref:X-box-binding protein 1 n=1 Tax=Dentipellis fragilis TaxID=205917 RepID=A0A4Y9YU77_9AGAM|nr:hypothetical protein EVG20_g5351 [Dentipellis fragilis]